MKLRIRNYSFLAESLMSVRVTKYPFSNSTLTNFPEWLHWEDSVCFPGCALELCNQHILREPRNVPMATYIIIPDKDP